MKINFKNNNEQNKDFYVLLIVINVTLLFLFFITFWVYQRVITIEEIKTNKPITPKIEIYEKDTVYIYRDYSTKIF